jgi:iron complex transport system permease protein
VTSSSIAATKLRPRWLIAAGGCLIGAIVLALLVGPIGLPTTGVLREIANKLPFVDLKSGLSEQQTAILWQLRAPRVVLGGLVGAALALAGAAYQGVFRNPLADPYLLGSAAGAGLGATLAIGYLPDVSWPVDPVPLAAFIGALFGVAVTYGLGRGGSRARTASTLILAGVAMASFLTAIQTYLQQRQSDTLRQVYNWILGQLTTSSWDEVWLVLPYLIVSAGVILLYRRLLDVMSVGDEEADALGVSAERIRLVIVVAASLGTAAAVAVSGLIGFVGIIVPHAIRLLFGTSYRLVLPLSILLGGAFMILTDLAARTAVAPAEIPIGVITAFIGAPFFLFVLRRSRRIV